MLRCESCSGGTSKKGQAYCEDCAAGTYLYHHGAGDAGVCRNCTAGRKSASGAANCTKCGRGFYSNDKGTDCEGCPRGRFGNVTGLSTAQCSGECPPGKYSSKYAAECQKCESGRIAADPGQSECSKCPDLQSSGPGEAACACEENWYMWMDGSCRRCPQGVDCSGVGSTLESLSVSKGRWRSSNSSEDVLTCPAKDACAGGDREVSGTGADYCKEGNTGVLCAVCQEGYERISQTKACELCQNMSIVVLWLLLGMVCTALAFALMLFANRRAPNGMLRPAINGMQQLSVMLMFDAPFPAFVVAAGTWVRTLNLDVDVAMPACIGVGGTFHARFTLLVLCVVLLLVLLWLPVLREGHRRGRASGEGLRSGLRSALHDSPQMHNAVRDSFIAVLLVHPKVTGTALQLFRCRQLAQHSYLMADYALHCYDSAWQAQAVLAGLVLGVFSLGTPIAMFKVLRARRADLEQEETQKQLGVLYAIYKPSVYYYESINMSFKILLWSTLVFFEHGSELQLSMALIVNILQLCVHVYLLPFGGDDAVLLNLLQAGVLVLTTYLNFGGLLINHLQLAVLYEQEHSKELTNVRIEGFQTQIGVFSSLMSVLLVFMLLCFAGTLIKKLVVRAGSATRALRSSLRGSISSQGLLRRLSGAAASVRESISSQRQNFLGRLSRSASRASQSDADDSNAAPGTAEVELKTIREQ